MIESTMNQTNQTGNQTSINDQTSNPWVESGAMVYVALTVATLSAVIMCCVWFVKHRLNSNVTNRYGSLSSNAEEQIELKQSDQLDSGSEEEIPLDVSIEESNSRLPTVDAFTLEASESESEEEAGSDGPTEAV
tara:strand:- start:2892 stop:3293 length:402 start_codon:yes stop_codon:yes gene_type:complete